MNQRQRKDTLLNFPEQAHRSLIKALQENLPLSLQARKLNAPLLWTILLYACLRRSSLESACQTLRAVPSANRLREHLSEQFNEQDLSLGELEERIRRVFKAVLPAKVIKQFRIKSWEVAGDWVEIPYDGEVTESDSLVRRSAAKRGTTHFYCFASLAVIHRRRRITIALTLVRAGEEMLAVVKRLLHQAQALGIKLKLTLWDKV